MGKRFGGWPIPEFKTFSEDQKIEFYNLAAGADNIEQLVALITHYFEKSRAENNIEEDR